MDSSGGWCCTRVLCAPISKYNTVSVNVSTLTTRSMTDTVLAKQPLSTHSAVASVQHGLYMMQDNILTCSHATVVIRYSNATGAQALAPSKYPDIGLTSTHSKGYNVLFN
jgi:hypothetical protein